MSASPVITCDGCGAIPTRHHKITLTKHGNIWLCRRCEDAATFCFCDVPGAPYSSEVIADAQRA